ncbi:MAG: hypothetical protein JO101_03080 [Candidatus Eremiobacteraeota bacterium]|nr:hypothetical protein [Candidatus Eremiobacteraeota bacterium]
MPRRGTFVSALLLVACAVVAVGGGAGDAKLFGRRAAPSPSPSPSATPFVVPSVVVSRTPYPTPTPYVPPLLLPLYWPSPR